MKEDVDNIDDEAGEEIDGKRGITYQVKAYKFTIQKLVFVLSFVVPD